MALTVVAHRTGSTVTLVVAGSMDLTHVDVLTDAIAATIDQPEVTGIVADLARVSFCDSSGVGALVRAHRTATTAGKTFHVAGARKMVLQILTLTGVWDYLSVPSEPETPAG